ncbi:MAG: Hpt domain-containing protein, partial [Bacteroidia bacterium]|nr:Hpt domain-containing protein [Bacteroidia bacterium]
PPLYDLSMLEEIGRGNQEFIQKMIQLFCAQTPVNVKHMIDAYHDGDLKKMGSFAHKMKPSIDSLKISSIQQDVRTIESAGKQNQNMQGLQDLLMNVQITTEKVIAQIESESVLHE